MSRRPARRQQRSCLRTAVLETLESRRMLAASVYNGSLNGKIVFTSGGHGWQWSSTLGRYATDRGDNNELVEDFGNQDQLTAYADYLLRAGATVVPMRPIGRQTNEVVVDNDSAAVTFAGAWSSSSSTRYYDEDYGAAADAVPYRFASTAVGAETATATYTPNIPSAGFYPVYTWVLRGTDRTQQLYRINHSDGQTEIRVDHSRVGSGWVYLGTYHFNNGSSATNGSVVVSNNKLASGTGSVVIADAIRFGNGMGDSTVSGGPSPSGYPREDENSWHWIARSVGVGTTLATAIGSGVNNVSAPSNFAEYMFQPTTAGVLGEAVYISFHSNAASGTARGAIGLIDADQFTPNQSSLALYTGRQINQDMMALDGQFEHNWGPRSSHSSSGGFGEIDLGADAEFDATIIEVGFHDNVQDAQLMRDPKARDQLARSTYEATLEYFNNFGGVASTLTLPSQPTNVRAVSNASGQVTVNWSAGPTGVRGGAAAGFRVYVSTNGYSFDGGTAFAGGGTVSGTISGLTPGVPYYFRVAAYNAAGESRASEVMTALPSGGAKQVLIVNGFDRHDRAQNFRYPYAHVADGLTDRVWTRYNNSFDYVIPVHSAIAASKPGTRVASTSNEAVVSGAVNLTDYDVVIWISGTESTADDTFNATEQTKVEQFIAAGGHFFASGAEIGWDLDQQNNGRTFFENSLKANYVGDDAGTYTATAAAGGIFDGLSSAVFSNGSAYSQLIGQSYDVAFPDVIAPQPGATVALNYSGGTGGGAAIQVPGTSGRGNVVLFGFPFESMTNATRRQQVMGRVLDYFVSPSATPGVPDLVASSDTGASVSDNVTRYDNSAGKPLQFSIANTVVGATVKLFIDNVEVASVVATGTTTPLSPAGTVANGAHTVYAQQAEPGKPATNSGSLSITVDTVLPTATLGSQTPAPGSSFFDFTVTYADALSGIDLFSISNLNFGVTGPNGYNEDAELVGVSGTIATYRMHPDGGTWDAADDGTYSINMSLGYGVRDNADNAVPAGSIGTFTFTAPFAYVANNTLHVNFVAPGGEVVFAANAANLDVTQGATTLSFPAAGFADVLVTGTAGSDTLTINDALAQPTTFAGGIGDDQLNVLAGTLTFTEDAANDAPGLGVFVGAGASVVFDATQHLRDLDVDGTATLTPGGGKVLVTKNLSGSGRLDLTDNDLVLDYDPTDPPGQLSALELLIASGSNGGAWDGTSGIVTTMPDAAAGLTSLGLGESSAVFGLTGSDTADFSGQTVDATAVLIKYTYAGDANLDGFISGDDYAAIDFNIAVPNASGWYNGDFNYDGIISGDDYAAIDFNIVAQGAPL